MPLPKFIPEKVFRIIAGVPALLCFVLLGYWTVAQKGIYLWFATRLTGADGLHDPVIAFLFTLLSTFVPLLLFIFVLRMFAQVKPLRVEMQNTDLLNSVFKIKSGADEQDDKYDPSLNKKRVLAFIIDRALIFVYLMPVIFVIMMLQEAVAMNKMLVVILSLLFILPAIAYAWARDFKNGQSLGRRLLKIRVVSALTGEPIGALKSLQRELLLHIGPLAMLELILLLTRPDGKRLGDLWAKTRVVAILPKI